MNADRRWQPKLIDPRVQEWIDAEDGRKANDFPGLGILRCMQCRRPYVVHPIAGPCPWPAP